MEAKIQRQNSLKCIEILEFIQMKCTVHDESMALIWKEIVDSVNRQHIDEANNKKKRIRHDSVQSAGNSTTQSDTQTSDDDSPETAARDPQWNIFSQLHGTIREDRIIMPNHPFRTKDFSFLTMFLTQLPLNNLLYHQIYFP